MNIDMPDLPENQSEAIPVSLDHRLEHSLIEQLSSLILGLGKGLALVGARYLLEVDGQDRHVDLLYYHLRLRRFVVVELEIEAYRTEFADKMNSYLSAVDEQLRHPDDQHSIGIIVCKGRSKTVVEYALRDLNRAIGASHHRVSSVLPKQLRRDLPTIKDLTHESPEISVVQLRIEIERALNDFTAAHGLLPKRPKSISTVLRELTERGLSPPSTDRFLDALRVMNEAVHGFSVNAMAVAEAVSVGTAFLEELSSSAA
jgi:hypothetical protein